MPQQEAPPDFQSAIRKAAAQRLLFLPHAIRQMSRLDRLIEPVDVRTVIKDGEIIEDYPEDSRGHSVLMLGRGLDGRPIHVVCAPKEEFLTIITAYLPERREWLEDFRIMTAR
ncbi:MAG: DUF4258 domain-containing protein [Calditrichota bacterium]